MFKSTIIIFYGFPQTHLLKSAFIFQTKNIGSYVFQMALGEIWVWAAECEDGRPVGPRPEVRGEIREITVKEYLILWSPF